MIKLPSEKLNSEVRPEQSKLSKNVLLLDEIRLLKEQNALLKRQRECNKKEFSDERKNFQTQQENWRKDEAKFLEGRKKFQDKEEKWKQLILKYQLELRQAKEKIKLEAIPSVDKSSITGPLAKIRRSSIRRKSGKKR